MKDCHDLHLKRDVLLLPDVFEKFENNSLKNYGLCSSHYLGAPALSWDVMLNMTNDSKLFHILTFTYFLKELRKVDFLIFLIDIVQSAISIRNLMTQNKNQNILYT